MGGGGGKQPPVSTNITLSSFSFCYPPLLSLFLFFSFSSSKLLVGQNAHLPTYQTDPVSSITSLLLSVCTCATGKAAGVLIFIIYKDSNSGVWTQKQCRNFHTLHASIWPLAVRFRCLLFSGGSRSVQGSGVPHGPQGLSESNSSRDRSLHILVRVVESLSFFEKVHVTKGRKTCPSHAQKQRSQTR